MLIIKNVPLELAVQSQPLTLGLTFSKLGRHKFTSVLTPFKETLVGRTVANTKNSKYLGQRLQVEGVGGPVAFLSGGHVML